MFRSDCSSQVMPAFSFMELERVLDEAIYMQVMNHSKYDHKHSKHANSCNLSAQQKMSNTGCPKKTPKFHVNKIAVERSAGHKFHHA